MSILNISMTLHRIPPKPKHFDTAPEGTCRWCNKKIGLTPKGRESKSRWHPACVIEYKLIHWPTATRKAVWQRDKGKCNTCSTTCTKKGATRWHMDHITPLIESNGNLKFWKMGNLQTLCTTCHKAKTGQEATERASRRRVLKERLSRKKP